MMCVCIGSDSIPKDLEKFAFPWTHFQQKKSKNEISTKRKALSFTTMKVLLPILCMVVLCPMKSKGSWQSL